MTARGPAAHKAIRWHRPLGWLGGVALVLFGLSGLTHPLMTWFGPQQAAFFAPQNPFSAREVAAIPGVLALNHIAEAQDVRAVPTARGNLLQVTAQDGVSRRYFSLQDGSEYPEFDLEQGKWLARHYTGLAETPIRTVTQQTTFDNAYPAVNRLLPVWRVAFDTDDNLVAFVHTELSALASLTNDTRTLQQGIFRNLHSWAWLETWEPVRVATLLVLCLALLALCLTGMVMVVALPGRHIRDGRRRWHRRLAFGIWIPLLAFAASGLYHLLHNAGETDPRGLMYGEPLVFGEHFSTAASSPTGGHGHHFAAVAGAALNSVTLVAGPEGRILYRLGRPAGSPGQTVDHHGRFDGTPAEGPAVFVDPISGEISHLEDEDLARLAAARHLDMGVSGIGASSLVTRFGPDYDFRNKRLPVWRVEYPGGTVFIDPANGALVDRTSLADRIEGAFFGHLHKWNFLTPWVGREMRDGLAALVIVIALAFASLGFAMLMRRPRR